MRKSDGPFVIRISCDGKPDRYYEDGDGVVEFPTMHDAFYRVKLLRRYLGIGECPAVVPVAWVQASHKAA